MPSSARKKKIVPTVDVAFGAVVGPEAEYVQFVFFFFNDTATTEIYTLSLHDALPIPAPSGRHDHRRGGHRAGLDAAGTSDRPGVAADRRRRDQDCAAPGHWYVADSTATAQQRTDDGPGGGPTRGRLPAEHSARARYARFCPRI